MKRRRCLIPADGFYEWQATGGRKQPYYVRAKSGGPLAFAGLWETWTGPNGEEVDTAAIVTTTRQPHAGAIHDRMPVIVPPEAFDLWLNCAEVDAETAAALIVPAPDDLLEAYEISTAVNRVANDNPKVLERLSGGAEPAVGAAAGGKARAPAAGKAGKGEGRRRAGGVVSTRLINMMADRADALSVIRPLGRVSIQTRLRAGCLRRQ